MIEETKFFGWFDPVTRAGSFVKPTDTGLKSAVQQTGIRVESFDELRQRLITMGYKADFVVIMHHETDGSYEIWRAVRNKLQGVS